MGGKTPKIPAPPKVQPVAAMPDPKDPMLNVTAKRAAAEKISSSGRASTIMPKDKGFG